MWAATLSLCQRTIMSPSYLCLGSITKCYIRADCWRRCSVFRWLWVVGAKNLIRPEIKYCVTCRNLRGSLGWQKMADQTEDRIQPTPQFFYVSVDIFGPWLTMSVSTSSDLGWPRSNGLEEGPWIRKDGIWCLLVSFHYQFIWKQLRICLPLIYQCPTQVLGF